MKPYNISSQSNQERHAEHLPAPLIFRWNEVLVKAANNLFQAIPANTTANTPPVKTQQNFYFDTMRIPETKLVISPVAGRDNERSVVNVAERIVEESGKDDSGVVRAAETILRQSSLGEIDIVKAAEDALRESTLTVDAVRAAEGLQDAR